MRMQLNCSTLKAERRDMKVKIGDCSVCGAKDTYLGRNNPPQCISCYKYLKAKQYKERADKRRQNQQKEEKPKKKPISPVSRKRLGELAEYRKRRDKYLKENPICEVRGCNNATTNLHHKAGRVGKLLTDVRYFMACCSSCHPRKIHETHPKWAEEQGYIIRLRDKIE